MRRKTTEIIYEEVKTTVFVYRTAAGEHRVCNLTLFYSAAALKALLTRKIMNTRFYGTNSKLSNNADPRRNELLKNNDTKLFISHNYDNVSEMTP